MVVVKASMKFLQENPETKVMTGQKIIDGINKNITIYNALPIPVDTLLERNNNLQKTRLAAMGGDKASGYALAAAEKAWIADFRKSVNYISFAADGNAELLADTNLTPTKDSRQKKKPITEINDFKATIGDGKGTFEASCASAGPGANYLYIGATPNVKVTLVEDTIVMTTASNEKIYIKVSTKSKAQVGGVASTEPLCVYMQAFNTAGSSPLTEGKEVTPQ